MCFPVIALLGERGFGCFTVGVSVLGFKTELVYIFFFGSGFVWCSLPADLLRCL